MAKFQLEPREVLIGKGPMALHQKQFLNTKNFSGTIYVTDRRACFYISMVGMEMDLPLGEIKGFSVKKGLITSVTIHSKAGESYLFTGFPAKKLQDWLRQVGVSEL